jgi:AraC-like DNA-binding protein
MRFLIYHIRSPFLKPYVQYILFNYSADKSFSRTLRSFANTNFCLGITKDKELSILEDGKFVLSEKRGIHSYLTGIYTNPYNFQVTGEQDEICIDFSPLGYHKFFRFQPRTFIFDNPLNEAFKKDSTYFFEAVFEERDFLKRGEMIEGFLMDNISGSEPMQLKQVIYLLERKNETPSVESIAEDMGCSERQVHRVFTKHFDIAPKEFMKVLRFRRYLQLIKKNTTSTAANAYELGYADQSHLIKEIKYFTGFTPKKLSQSLHHVEDTVLFSIH